MTPLDPEAIDKAAELAQLYVNAIKEQCKATEAWNIANRHAETVRGWLVAAARAAAPATYTNQVLAFPCQDGVTVVMLGPDTEPTVSSPLGRVTVTRDFENAKALEEDLLTSRLICEAVTANTVGDKAEMEACRNHPCADVRCVQARNDVAKGRDLRWALDDQNKHVLDIANGREP